MTPQPPLDLHSVISVGGPTAAVVIVLTAAVVVLWRGVGREVVAAMKASAAEHAKAQTTIAATSAALERAVGSVAETAKVQERTLADLLRLVERLERRDEIDSAG